MRPSLATLLSCNVIKGKDPSTLTIGLTKTDDLLLYFPNLCRSMTFRYRRTVELANISAFRYSPLEETFHNPQVGEVQPPSSLSVPCPWLDILMSCSVPSL